MTSESENRTETEAPMNRAERRAQAKGRHAPPAERVINPTHGRDAVIPQKQFTARRSG